MRYIYLKTNKITTLTPRYVTVSRVPLHKPDETSIFLSNIIGTPNFYNKFMVKHPRTFDII
jgi:hypothetical protein